jgi:hypothetical protein
MIAAETIQPNFPYFESPAANGSANYRNWHLV